LRQWGVTCERACEAMIADIRAGKLWDDTMAGHFEYLRHLKGRWECIVGEIRKENSRHRGPGMPGYVDLDRGKGQGLSQRQGPHPPATQAPSPTQSESFRAEGKAFGEGSGRDVDH